MAARMTQIQLFSLFLTNRLQVASVPPDVVAQNATPSPACGLTSTLVLDTKFLSVQTRQLCLVATSHGWRLPNYNLPSCPVSPSCPWTAGFQTLPLSQFRSSRRRTISLPRFLSSLPTNIHAVSSCFKVLSVTLNEYDLHLHQNSLEECRKVKHRLPQHPKAAREL